MNNNWGENPMEEHESPGQNQVTMKYRASNAKTRAVTAFLKGRRAKACPCDMNFRATREALALSAYFIINRGRDLSLWPKLPNQMNPLLLQHGC